MSGKVLVNANEVDKGLKVKNGGAAAGGAVGDDEPVLMNQKLHEGDAGKVRFNRRTERRATVGRGVMGRRTPQ